MHLYLYTQTMYDMHCIAQHRHSQLFYYFVCRSVMVKLWGFFCLFSNVTIGTMHTLLRYFYSMKTSFYVVRYIKKRWIKHWTKKAVRKCTAAKISYSCQCRIGYMPRRRHTCVRARDEERESERERKSTACNIISFSFYLSFLSARVLRVSWACKHENWVFHMHFVFHSL